MAAVKIPSPKNEKELNTFFKQKRLLSILKNQKDFKNTYKPDLADLYSLYQFIVLNKRTTILEFGSGWSSLVLSFALYELKQKYTLDKITLRRENLFELFILENEKKYLNITKKRIQKNLKKNLIKISFNYSDVNMINFNGRFATEYSKLPLCNPDFIYLDGPDQFKIKNDIKGFSTKHNDLMPMICDILKFEYFLIPGCIILIDGRGANAKFLKDNLKRKWSYKKLKHIDQHLFTLNDPSLGKHNDKLLNFYKS